MLRALSIFLAVLFAAGSACALDCSGGPQWVVNGNANYGVHSTPEALCAALDTYNGGYGHSVAAGGGVCLSQYPDYPDTPFAMFNACAFSGDAGGASSSGNPFVMSVADGVELSALILAVWLAAAVARWLIKALGMSDADSSST